MKPTMLVVGFAFLVACGGGHDAADPTTVPIDAVTTDAVYVVNGGDASIAVIDASTAQVVDTIELSDGEYPHHLYLSPDRREMFLAIPGVDLSGGHGGGHGDEHSGGGYAMRLDASTGETLAVAALESSNHNAAPSPVDATVWTTQMDEPGKVLILDRETLETQAEVEVEDMPAEVTFAFDSPVAFVANGGSDSVSAIDAATLEVLATIAVGDNPVGAWPGTDNVMYVDNETGKSISAIDPESLEVVLTYELGFTPGFAAILGEELWVTDVDGGRVVVFDRASGDEMAAIDTGAGAHAIAFSADRAWVTNQEAASVSVIDTGTREVVDLVDVGAKPNGIVYREAP
jgi:YVTN family beta-propeller protein